MHTRSLKSLIKISQVQSFREAADQLGMTLSALSMQMKSLEQSLNVLLFDRSVRPPRLTPIGRAIVAEALPLLRQEDKLIALCQRSEDLAGRFRLGFITTAAVRFLPGFLAASKQDAPYATFEFETGLSATLQHKVLTGQLDAAIITDADGLPSRLSSRILRQEPFVFAAHRGLVGKGLLGLMEQSDFLHFMPDTGIGKLIEVAMLNYERSPKARTIVLDNLEVIMECVAAQLGFTLLPIPDVERYLTSEIKIFPAPVALERKLVLVTLRDSALDRSGDKLVELLDQ